MSLIIKIKTIEESISYKRKILWLIQRLMSLRPYTTRGAVAVFYLNICISYLFVNKSHVNWVFSETLIINYVRETTCMFTGQKDRSKITLLICTKLKIVLL